MVLCQECGEHISDAHHAIECGECKKRFHVMCLGRHEVPESDSVSAWRGLKCKALEISVGPKSGGEIVLWNENDEFANFAPLPDSPPEVSSPKKKRKKWTVEETN